VAKSKFSLPKPIDAARLEAFAAGAEGRTEAPATPQLDQAKRKQAPTKRRDLRAVAEFGSLQEALQSVVPDEDLDPAAKPTFALNIRLNAYELALIRFLAQQGDRSQHWVVKRNLLPVLEQQAQDIVGEEWPGPEKVDT